MGNMTPRDSCHQFSFERNNQYHIVRTTATLNVRYHVSNEFENHYSEGTQAMADFEKRVEVIHITKLQSRCNYEVMIAGEHKRACKEVQKIKKNHPRLYQAALRHY